MIGLCIKYWNKNYGSMLQCFAFTNYLKKENYTYKILRFQKKRSLSFVFKMGWRFVVNPIFRNDILEMTTKKVSTIFNNDFKKCSSQRSMVFSSFSKENFEKDAIYAFTYKDLIKKSEEFSIIISGSDQLLSPSGFSTHFYSLEFCSQKVKRVTYGSSFGVSYIPKNQIKGTKKYLNELNSISVREESASRIIEKLISKQPTIVCDPVALLSKNEWDELVKNENVYSFKYIFAYFLGDNKEYRLKVKQFADEKNLKIVTLKHLDQFVKNDIKFGDYSPYNVSPINFLNLIRNAEYIFTDSYHGSLFSIINNKKFLSFFRYPNKSKVSKNTRIETLMSTLGLDMIYNGNIYKVDEEVDYSVVNEKLDLFRNESINYLKEALKDDTNN